MTTTAGVLAAEMARFLRDTYLPRMRRALDALPEGDLWWRPHDEVLSFGVMLLHLEGNVRQWILSGVAAAPDHRDRAGEFAATDGPSGEELFARLTATVEAAASVIEGLDEAALLRSYSIQGFDVTGVYAVSHVVEHFSWHTGQAVWLAKARAGAGHGVAFYDDSRVNTARNG
ncbi:MAG: DinB family protein [Planctomycetota bacterium]